MADHTGRGDGTLFGTVKWFDPSRGFGFVVVDSESTDVLLHANVLRNFGQSSVADGAKIELVIQRTERGIQAVEIVAIEPPAAESTTGIEGVEGLSADEIQSLALEPARIKWFDKAKGFGFANVFGDDDDIFVHIEVLRRSGLSDLIAGEAVALRITDGQRGKMAVTVNAWEAAIKK